jgi:hypothetical protein
VADALTAWSPHVHNKIGADVPKPGRDVLVVTALVGLLGFAVGEVATPSHARDEERRPRKEIVGAWAGAFTRCRSNGTNSRWTVAGSSALNDVLTTPGCTTLAVTTARSGTGVT